MWAVLDPSSGWQVLGQVNDKGETELCLLAESADAGRQAALTSDPDRIAHALQLLAPEATLMIQQRRHDGRRPHYDDPRVWRSESGAEQLRDMVTNARAMGGLRISPHFQLTVPLWAAEQRLTEARASYELQEGIKRIRQVLSEAWL
jgi:hypothetical protein